MQQSLGMEKLFEVFRTDSGEIVLMGNGHITYPELIQALDQIRAKIEAERLANMQGLALQLLRR